VQDGLAINDAFRSPGNRVLAHAWTRLYPESGIPTSIGDFLCVPASIVDMADAVGCAGRLVERENRYRKRGSGPDGQIYRRGRIAANHPDRA
jgi:hypothetical protein